MKSDKWFVSANALFPIILGALIYYLISPDVYFVKKIDYLLGIEYHFVKLNMNNIFIKCIRYYFIDVLWAYSLVFALYFFVDNETGILIPAFVFVVFMELIQIFPDITGTFDFLDIIVEGLGEIVAVFIIKLHCKFRRKKV